MRTVDEILKDFSPISLQEMDSVSLMDRTDAKYVLNEDKLAEVLEACLKDYRVLEISGTRKHGYKTVYFDTPDFHMYTAHQNGKMNRYKIRNREYAVSGINFMEIKFKNNKGKTKKKRIQVTNNEPEYSKEISEFIRKNTPFEFSDLTPVLWNEFSRLTLVHHQAIERITIDTGLKFKTVDSETNVPEISIAEIKASKVSANSDFIKILRSLKVRELRISKYCIGSALLNSDVKHNRFKPKILTLKKLSNGKLDCSDHLAC